MRLVPFFYAMEAPPGAIDVLRTKGPARLATPSFFIFDQVFQRFHFAAQAVQFSFDGLELVQDFVAPFAFPPKLEGIDAVFLFQHLDDAAEGFFIATAEGHTYYTLGQSEVFGQVFLAHANTFKGSLYALKNQGIWIIR